jgi:hypothetical protein
MTKKRIRSCSWWWFQSCLSHPFFVVVVDDDYSLIFCLVDVCLIFLFCRGGNDADDGCVDRFPRTTKNCPNPRSCPPPRTLMTKKKTPHLSQVWREASWRAWYQYEKEVLDLPSTACADRKRLCRWTFCSGLCLSSRDATTNTSHDVAWLVSAVDVEIVLALLLLVVENLQPTSHVQCIDLWIDPHPSNSIGFVFQSADCLLPPKQLHTPVD